MIFRAGNDLLLEEYLDGVEFDVDLVMHDGECLFSSVSQNWPTAEPSFQETGPALPARPRPQGRGTRRRPLRADGAGVRAAPRACCTSRASARAAARASSRSTRGWAAGRIHEIVDAVWGVDLDRGAAARAASTCHPPQAEPQAAQCTVVNSLIYAPASGRLAALPFADRPRRDGAHLAIDVEAEVGDDVDGPDAVFATVLAEVTLAAKDLRHARADLADVLRERPRVEPAG